MSVDLYPFQEEAVRLTGYGPGILLHHSAGLGKTISGLSIATQDRFDQVLFVGPAKVIAQAAGEARSKFGLKPFILRGRTPAAKPLTARMVMVNYAVVAHHRESLEVWAKKKRTCIIIDESHMLGNWAAFWKFTFDPVTLKESPSLNTDYRGGAVLSIRKRCTFAVLLTATPAPVARRQVYSQFRILMGSKGNFPDWQQFQRLYCNWHMDENGYPNSLGVSRSPQFRALVAPYTHRAQRSVWAHLLPAVSRRVEYIPLSEQTKRGAIGFMKQALKDFRISGSGRQSKIMAEIALGAFKKQKAFKEFLRLSKDNGRKTLVFVNRLGLVEMYAKAAEKAGYKTFRISGAQTHKEVERALAESRALDEPHVVVATIQRAGESLNLQHLNTIWWATIPRNAGQALQGEGRILRLGSPNTDADIFWPILQASFEEEHHINLLARLGNEDASFGSDAAMDIVNSNANDESWLDDLLALD